LIALSFLAETGSLFMSQELEELIETAMYKEIASNAFYSAGLRQTEDRGAIALLSELAEDELGHLEKLKKLKEGDWNKTPWVSKRVADLKLSDYISGSDKLEGAGLQDALISAIKHEQKAVDFYSRMTSLFRDEEAKSLCQWLAQQELNHKQKLEKFYDDFFYAED
jgi:rubrerythrin